MKKWKFHYEYNNFNDCENVSSKLESFAKDLEKLMKKYKLKTIYPYLSYNAQITRNITENELHIIGMCFEHEQADTNNVED